jgi:hypothetical protein
MPTLNLVDNTTAAVTTGDIPISQDEGVVSFFQTGLAGVETIVVQQKVNGSYEPIVESGAAIVLDVNNTNQICRGPAIVRLVKGVTAGNVSVDSITRQP